MPSSNGNGAGVSVTVNQRGDWDFEVIEKKVLIPTDDDPENYSDIGEVRTHTGLSDVVPNHKAILREDSGQVFYIGSDKYRPVPHRVVLAPVITHFAAPSYRVRIKSVNHGAQVFADFISDRSFEMGGERYRSGIRIVNSMDGTLRLTIEGFIFRERDDSYLVLSETLSSFRRVHVQGHFDDADFARIAREAMENATTKASALASVAGTHISNVAFSQFIDRIDMAAKYKRLAIEIWETPGIVQIDDSAAGTFGAVMNLLAYLGTHELGRALNDEAMYRWQKNVDAVIHRQLKVLSPDWATTSATPAPLSAEGSR